MFENNKKKRKKKDVKLTLGLDTAVNFQHKCRKKEKKKTKKNKSIKRKEN